MDKKPINQAFYFLYYRKLLLFVKENKKIKGTINMPQNLNFEVKLASYHHLQYLQDYNHKTLLLHLPILHHQTKVLHRNPHQIF